MTVRELIDMAKYGELRNVAIVENDAAMLGYINLGILELAKRFPMYTEEAIIRIQEGKALYKLDGTDTDVQLSDTNKTYMWIVAAYTEVEIASVRYTVQLPVNEDDDINSVNTIGYNQVQLPAVKPAGDYISIIYVAAPKMLTLTDVDSVLPLPPQMVETLLHYVGYRGHESVNGAIQSEHVTHYQRFEQSCKKIEESGMFNINDVSTDLKFINGIWA